MFHWYGHLAFGLNIYVNTMSHALQYFTQLVQYVDDTLVFKADFPLKMLRLELQKKILLIYSDHHCLNLNQKLPTDYLI